MHPRESLQTVDFYLNEGKKGPLILPCCKSCFINNVRFLDLFTSETDFFYSDRMKEEICQVWMDITKIPWRWKFYGFMKNQIGAKKAFAFCHCLILKDISCCFIKYWIFSVGCYVTEWRVKMKIYMNNHKVKWLAN